MNQYYDMVIRKPHKAAKLIEELERRAGTEDRTADPVEFIVTAIAHATYDRKVDAVEVKVEVEESTTLQAAAAAQFKIGEHHRLEIISCERKNDGAAKSS